MSAEQRTNDAPPKRGLYERCKTCHEYARTCDYVLAGHNVPVRERALLQVDPLLAEVVSAATAVREGSDAYAFVRLYSALDALPTIEARPEPDPPEHTFAGVKPTSPEGYLRSNLWGILGGLGAESVESCAARVVRERDQARAERDEYRRAYNGIVAVRAEQRTEREGGLNSGADPRKLRAAVDAAMAMYVACPADPDATDRYEAAVDTFIDALAAVGLRLPLSTPVSGQDPKDVAGSTPAGASTVAGSRMPEGEWGVGAQPQAVEDSRNAPLMSGQDGSVDPNDPAVIELRALRQLAEHANAWLQNQSDEKVSKLRTAIFAWRSAMRVIASASPAKEKP